VSRGLGEKNRLNFFWEALPIGGIVSTAMRFSAQKCPTHNKPADAPVVRSAISAVRRWCRTLRNLLCDARSGAPIIAAGAVFLSGCATPSSDLYPGHVHSRTDPDNVRIYESFPPDRSSYDIIGEVRFDTDVVEVLPSVVNKQFKREAAKKGADAIVIDRSATGMIVRTVPGTITTHHGPSYSTSTYTNPSYVGHKTTKITGIMLKFK